MRYKVRSLAADGSVVSQVHDAAGAAELRARLAQDGATLLSIRPHWPALAGLRRNRGGHDRHLIFCNQLQTLLAA